MKVYHDLFKYIYNKSQKNGLGSGLQNSLNILGCRIAIVGNTWGTGQKQKTITIDNKFVCPSVVDKTNWMGETTYKDKFEVSQNVNKVTVTRIDVRSKWKMNLIFSCCSKI